MLLMLLLPAAILLVTAGVSALSGALVTDHCPVLRVFGNVLIPAVRHHQMCTSVHFMVDIPSITLAVTSALAVASYFAFQRRTRSLVGNLVSTGLLAREKLCTAALEPDDLVRIPRVYRALSLPASVALALALYYIVLHGSLMFHDFAGGAKTAVVSKLRESWWANWSHHKVLAIMWVATGTIGTYYASKSARTKYQVRRWATRPQPTGLFQYVPRWQNKAYGWGPAWKLISIAYLSIVTFIFSLAVTLYLLRGVSIGVVVVAVVAVLASLLSNGRFLVSGVLTIRHRHSDVVSARVAVVRDALLEAQPASVEQLFWAQQSQELVDVPDLPVSGKARTIVPIIGGITAVLTFAHALIRLTS